MSRIDPVRARAAASPLALRGGTVGLSPPGGAAFALLGVANRRTTIGVDIACGFNERLLGWLGRERAPAERGLWISPCDGVHTFAMRFAIDVLFLDRAGRIVRADHAVEPWRARICVGAHSVIELRAGLAAELGLEAGTTFELRSV